VKKVRYIGPFEAVAFAHPDGWEIEVRQNEVTPDLPDAFAKSLLEQASNWEAAETGSSSKKEKE
jgi:hypothetical protein